jgi:hypothetical protein
MSFLQWMRKDRHLADSGMDYSEAGQGRDPSPPRGHFINFFGRLAIVTRRRCLGLEELPMGAGHRLASRPVG